jgi:hypothetical protein
MARACVSRVIFQRARGMTVDVRTHEPRLSIVVIAPEGFIGLSAVYE